jgi:hypothetical protein
LAIVGRDSEMTVHIVFKNTHIPNVSQVGMKVDTKRKIIFVFSFVGVEGSFQEREKYPYRFFPFFSRLIKKFTVGSI